MGTDTVVVLVGGGEGMGMTKMRIGVTLCAFLITDFLFVCFNG